MWTDTLMLQQMLCIGRRRLWCSPWVSHQLPALVAGAQATTVRPQCAGRNSPIFSTACRSPTLYSAGRTVASAPAAGWDSPQPSLAAEESRRASCNPSTRADTETIASGDKNDRSLGGAWGFGVFFLNTEKEEQ